MTTNNLPGDGVGCTGGSLPPARVEIPLPRPLGTDPAAVEAVAKALYDETDSEWSTAKRCATPVISALSAIGWVEGQRHAVQLDAVIREAVRADQAETKLAAITRERDAMRAALEKITRLPIYGHDPQDAIALATAGLTAAKGTP